MYSGIWSMHLPAPVFWGVLAAWIPVPPSIMAGIFIAAIAYAFLNYLVSLRDWAVDDEEPLIPLAPNPSASVGRLKPATCCE